MDCRLKRVHGTEYCSHDCPAIGQSFRFARVERSQDVPPPDPRAVDVVLLDMNHRWPNLGHDSLVQDLRDIACDLIPDLLGTGIHLRVVSYEVRVSHTIPEGPGARFALYVGSGGPGNIDPHGNDGVSAGSQNIREDAAWERPLFELFDAIQRDERAALLSVCHSFGVMCRWSGIARPLLRGPGKGGKSNGIRENILTPEALQHPWFERFAQDLPDRRRLRVVDNRLFDLIPERPLRNGFVPIGYETQSDGGPRGDAITMLEWARDRGGVMPRVFGVNHHPEIVDRRQQMMILRHKRECGEVTTEWFEERALILTQQYPNEDSDARLQLTSDYTLLTPLRFHIYRAVRERAEALGVATAVHEDRVIEDPYRGTLRAESSTAP